VRPTTMADTLSVSEPLPVHAEPLAAAVAVAEAASVEATVTEEAMLEYAEPVMASETDAAAVAAATAEVAAAAAAASAAAHAAGEMEGDDDTIPGQKRRRNRQSFNRSQVSMLEHIFTNTPMPRQALLNELSQRLDIPPRSVRVWFQNRRQRWKAMHQAAGQTPPPLRNAEDRLTSLEKLLPDLPAPSARVPGMVYPTQFSQIPMLGGGTSTTATLATAIPGGIGGLHAIQMATAIPNGAATASATPATGAYRAVRLVGVHGTQPVFRMEELTEVPNLMRTPTGGLLKLLPSGGAIEYAALGTGSGGGGGTTPLATAAEAEAAEIPAVVAEGAGLEVEGEEVPAAAPAELAPAELDAAQ